MRLNRALALGATLLVLMSACTSGGGSSKPTIKIGSDGFYESKLMAEIYAQDLEANGYTVDRTGMAIGARKVSAAALESGQIDLKPEYIGSGLAYYEPGKQTGDPKANADRAPERPQRQGWRDHRPRLHAGPGPERVRRPRGHRGPVPPDQDERPDRGPGPAQVRRRDRLPDEPGLRRGASSRPTGSTSRRQPCCRRATRRWPRPCSARRSTSASCARRSPTSWSTAGSSSRTTSRPSRPTTSRRSSATTTWPRSTRPRSRRSSTPSRPRWTRPPCPARQADLRRQEGHRRRREVVAPDERLREVASRAAPNTSPRHHAGGSSIPAPGSSGGPGRHRATAPAAAAARRAAARGRGRPSRRARRASRAVLPPCQDAPRRWFLTNSARGDGMAEPGVLLARFEAVAS